MSASGRSSSAQNRAAKAGLQKISLESTWWGNQKLGTWTDTAYVLIDHQTEDAVHLAFGTYEADGRAEVGHRDSFRDIWLPKSKVTLSPEPECETYSPDGDSEGEVWIIGGTQSKYGPKAAMWGDTYGAFKESDPDISFNSAHHTYNGICWECDLDAASEVAEALAAEGYTVHVSARHS